MNLPSQFLHYKELPFFGRRYSFPTHLYTSSSCHSPLKKKKSSSSRCGSPWTSWYLSLTAGAQLNFRAGTTGSRYGGGDHVLWSNSDTQWLLNKFGKSHSHESRLSHLGAFAGTFNAECTNVTLASSADNLIQLLHTSLNHPRQTVSNRYLWSPENCGMKYQLYFVLYPRIKYLWER